MKENKSDIKIVLVVLLVIAVIIGVFVYDAKRTKIEPLANDAANKLISSMNYIGELPYSVEEYKLRAIVFCGDYKLFVEDDTEYGIIVLDCSYMLAGGVELVPKINVLNSEVSVVFKKIPIE